MRVRFTADARTTECHMTKITFLVAAAATLVVAALMLRALPAAEAQPLPSREYGAATRLHKSGMPFRTINNYFLNRYSKRAAGPPGFFHGFGKRVEDSSGDASATTDGSVLYGGNDETAFKDNDSLNVDSTALEARKSIELLRALIGVRDQLLRAILSPKKPVTSTSTYGGDGRYDVSTP